MTRFRKNILVKSQEITALLPFIVLYITPPLFSRDWVYSTEGPVILWNSKTTSWNGIRPQSGIPHSSPLLLQILMILVQCFMMIDVWMLGRDWGCGVRDPSRFEKACTLPVNGIGPQWGITHSSPHPPCNMG